MLVSKNERFSHFLGLTAALLIESNRIFGLEVLDYHKEDVLKLPMAFTREVVPANKSQIPKSQFDCR